MWSVHLPVGVILILLGWFSAATEANWPYASFKTGPWQPPQLQLNKTAGVDPGLIFIPIRNENSLGTAVTIYDNNGEMIYQGPEVASMNFRVQKLFGEDVLTYWSGEAGVYGGYGYGKVHILDKTYQEIHTITLTDNFVTGDNETRDSYIDVHEHFITDNNTILVSAINITQHNLSSFGRPSDSWITTNLFYEIDIATNEVIFKWNALDHQDKIPLSKSRQWMYTNPIQAMSWDPYHTNSITPTKDGYIVSMRFYCSAFYLNKDGTVRWQLSGNIGDGDFTGEDLRFSWQHDIRIYNETDKHLVLSLFNNAKKQNISQSETTAMVFDIDLTTMTGSLLHNLSDPTNAIYAGTQGNLEFLDKETATSNMFVGYGSVPYVKEYNSKGEVVLSGKFGALEHAMSYRAFKNKWEATPFWNPAAVIKDGIIYMSWNGATEYDNWAVYYSLSSLVSDATHPMSTHPRTGFETNMSISDTGAKFVKVAARKGETILRFSDPVEV